MLNLGVSLDALVVYCKNTVLIEYLTLHCHSRELQDLLLVLQLLATLLLHKFSLVIIFSLLSIKLSTKLLNIDIVLEINLIAVVSPFEQHGELSAMEHCIILSHLKHTLHIHLDLKLWCPVIQSKQKVSYCLL